MLDTEIFSKHTHTETHSENTCLAKCTAQDSIFSFKKIIQNLCFLWISVSKLKFSSPCVKAYGLYWKSQSSSHKSEVIHYWNPIIEESVSLWIGVRLALHFSDTTWMDAFIFSPPSKYHLFHVPFHSNAN